MSHYITAEYGGYVAAWDARTGYIYWQADGEDRPVYALPDTMPREGHAYYHYSPVLGDVVAAATNAANARRALPYIAAMLAHPGNLTAQRDALAVS